MMRRSSLENLSPLNTWQPYITKALSGALHLPRNGHPQLEARKRTGSLATVYHTREMMHTMMSDTMFNHDPKRLTLVSSSCPRRGMPLESGALPRGDDECRCDMSERIAA